MGQGRVVRVVRDHSGADVDVDDGGAVHVGRQLLLQLLVINLP